MIQKSGFKSYLKISILIFVCCIFLIHNVTASDVTMFRGDPQHTGVYDNGGINPDGILIWKFTTGGGVDSSPAVSNGVVYTGSNDKNIYAFNAATGVKTWNFTTEGQIFSSPAVVNGIVYIGSGAGNIQTQVYNGTVYALDAATGAKIWDFDALGEFKSSPAVMDGIVYIGSVDDNVYALNATAGTEIWHFDVGEMTSSPAVANGVVYIGSQDGNLYALNATTGDEIWHYATGSWITSSPTVANGVVYVGSHDHNVYALNAATGAEIWRYVTGSRVESSPAIANGVVYIGSNDHNVYALNATTGAEIWHYTTGYYVGSSPAVANSVVYVGSFDNKVYALDAVTGTEIWHYTTGGLVMSSPAIANGVVYVGSQDGNVYAIGSSPDNTGSIAFSSTPGDAQIYLGGNNSGHTTPYTLAGITPGQHAVTLKLNGYHDYNQNVTVVTGQTSVVNATLSPEGWTPITAPCIISTPGHYRLTNDLTNSTAETAIWIQSSDVFLSGDGHTLNGISAENTTGVLASMDGVTLSNITMVNLSVTGWQSGFTVFGVEHGGLLWSCSATGNNKGVIIAESPSFTIGLCTVEDNIPYMDHGISMGGTGVTLSNSSGTYILDSNISHNGWGDNPPYVGGYGILLVDCPGVLVEECTINKNINTGIWNTESPGMRVIGNEFHDNSGNGGIFMTALEETPVMNCTIQDNHISGSGWGIFLRNNNYLVKNNQVSECGYGILLESSQNATLEGNTLNDNEVNLAVNGQNEEEYHHQIDISNTVNGKPVYYLVGQTGAVVNETTNAGVVFGISCPDLTIRDLELRHNEYGVFLLGSERAIISNVTSLENAIGFNILSSKAVLLDHCTATLNPINGFKILNSDRVLIRNSEAYNNNDPEGGAGTGISIQDSSSFRMENVVSTHNSMFGIELDNAELADIENATVNSNRVAGIVVKGDTIQIIGSSIRDNEGPGIGMLDSNNVSIWNNNFSNNENVGISEVNATGTTWNITKTTGSNIVNGPFLGGNYWAKPDGTGWSQVTPDRGDGFCSAPFVLDANNTDYLPLHTYTPPPSNDNITLGVGWNMVSVPKKLAPGYDTGSILKNVTTEGRTIWEYDGVIRNWVPVSEDTPVLPLYGFWIYSKYPTTVPLKFDPNPLQVPPTRKLVKGWELIGFTGTIPASARDTLISVRNNWTQAMGFDTTAYQYDIQIINGGSGPFSDSRLMYPTKGYWLFMTGPGDLSAIGV